MAGVPSSDRAGQDRGTEARPQRVEFITF